MCDGSGSGVKVSNKGHASFIRMKTSGGFFFQIKVLGVILSVVDFLDEIIIDEAHKILYNQQ